MLATIAIPNWALGSYLTVWPIMWETEVDLQICLNTPVSGFKFEAGRIRAVLVQQKGQTVDIDADAVISSIPLPPGSQDAGAVLTGLPSPEVFNMPLSGDVSPHTWQYLSDPDILATRLQEPRRRSPYMSPPASVQSCWRSPAKKATHSGSPTSKACVLGMAIGSSRHTANSLPG